jgi:hypothetical protein
VSWAIHLHFIKGFTAGFEIVDVCEESWFLVIDLFIVRIGFEVERK